MLGTLFFATLPNLICESDVASLSLAVVAELHLGEIFHACEVRSLGWQQ